MSNPEHMERRLGEEPPVQGLLQQAAGLAYLVPQVFYDVICPGYFAYPAMNEPAYCEEIRLRAGQTEGGTRLARHKVSTRTRSWQRSIIIELISISNHCLNIS